MKILLSILLALVSFCGFSQSETHNFITYDTLFNFSGLQWQVRISRPANLFTVGNADTASRPSLFYMPGQGQQGNTDSNNLTAYGPHRQYNPYTGGNGWDGGFQFGNGRHFPMYFTVSFINNVTPNPSYYYTVLAYLISHYHVKSAATYLCGFSEGAFTSGGIIEYEGTLGDHAGMKLVTAMFIQEGTPTCPACEFPARTQNCSTSLCDTNYYVTWATTYHGREAYLEGSGSDDFRDGWHWTQAMNNAVPNSGYFSYENAGGGAHCCWDSLESIYQVHWRSVAPLGTYNAPSQTGTNTMGTYIDGQSMFKWLFTQGDTSLVGGGGHVPVTYTWPSTTRAIRISKSVYPTLGAGDTIYVHGYSPGGGYSSLNIDTAGSMTQGDYIHVVFTDTAYIQIDTVGGPTFLNNIDSANYIQIVGMNMSYNVNPTFTTYQAHAHSHFIYFKNCTFRQSSGFFLTTPGSSPIPNFTGGANDTVNCFYRWTFDHCVWDTVGSAAFGGIQCLQMGDTLVNQMWLRLRVTGSRFNYLPNPTTGAGAISLKNCFMCEIDHDTVSNMGVVESPGSHAALIGINESLVYVHDNYFGPNNFGNCVRSNGMGTIPAMATLFTSWDSHYNGVGRVYGNIDMRSRKYPFFQSNFGGPITTLSYYQGRRSPDVVNNTLYRLWTGATDSLSISHQSYNISVFDGLAITGFTDTVYVHNNVMCGPTDTTAGVCTPVTCQSLITYSGAAPHYDTSGNSFFATMVFATSGLSDTTNFYPLTSGPLYHHGTTSPVYRTVDMNGTAVPSSAPSIGAVEPITGAPPTVSAGSNQTITLPTSSVTLAGSASPVFPATTISTYAWTQTSGPNTGTFSSTTITNPTFSGLIAGTYVLKLTATDNNGLVNNANVTITVNTAPGPSSITIQRGTKIGFTNHSP